MPRADQATIDLLTDYFQAMEVKDFDRLGAYYADDITQTFANAPTITGRDTMLANMVDLLGKVTSLAHPLINVWQEEDGVVISTSITPPSATSSPSPRSGAPHRLRLDPGRDFRGLVPRGELHPANPNQ